LLVAFAAFEDGFWSGNLFVSYKERRRAIIDT